MFCPADGSGHISQKRMRFHGDVQYKHCPEFGQVARNSFRIHGVVSKIPRILHHLHGSGLFSVFFETEPCWWDKYPINYSHTKTLHTKDSSRNLKLLSEASSFFSEVQLFFPLKMQCSISSKYAVMKLTIVPHGKLTESTLHLPSVQSTGLFESGGCVSFTKCHCSCLFQQIYDQHGQILTSVR